MSTVTSADGTRIAYDRTGSGDPLVLVGGAFSYRRYPGQVKLAGLLAGHFTVYSYDRRGRGDSGDTAPYAVDREIEDLAAVIEAAGGQAHVWGLSSGAMLALRAAGGWRCRNRPWWSSPATASPQPTWISGSRNWSRPAGAATRSAASWWTGWAPLPSCPAYCA